MDGHVREGMLLGMCNPLLDISATVDGDLLAKYHMKPNDAILAEDQHMPLYKELVEQYKVEYIAGGAAQNALRVAQWLLGKPKVCVFFGCIGRDEFGEILVKKATEDGVDVQYQYNEKQPTGTCAVLITNNGTQRSLCANLAAANHFTPDHIRLPENKKIVQSVDYVYVSGFFLTVSVESILEVAEVALQRNKLFCMNLSAPFLSQLFKTQMMKVMPYVDILFGNETEAAVFAKEQDLEEKEDLHKVALLMTRLPKQNTKRSRIVIITQGAEPVILAKDGETKEFPVSLLPPEKLVDTNGAGDAFVGGFLAQLIQGASIDQCIDCGVWAATEIVQRSGCTFDGPAHYTP
uniref:Adenosine kinase n=1 Tax=Homalodisca liturata TaxID=320908 RepID=A0A1B6J821_9HEMI